MGKKEAVAGRTKPWPAAGFSLRLIKSLGAGPSLVDFIMDLKSL